MHVRRAQLPLVQSKFPAHGAVGLHPRGVQRALAGSQVSPSVHGVLSTQPIAHAIAPLQLHWIGSQIWCGPWVEHCASPVQSPGIVLHAPQPSVTPGCVQLPVEAWQGSAAEQQMPLGQPSAGHIAGTSLAARQPRNAMSQPQPSQRSGAHPDARRQSPSVRP